MLGWSDVQAKATSSTHLLFSMSSLPLHLPCLFGLVVSRLTGVPAEKRLAVTHQGVDGNFQRAGKSKVLMGFLQAAQGHVDATVPPGGHDLMLNRQQFKQRPWKDWSFFIDLCFFLSESLEVKNKHICRSRKLDEFLVSSQTSI